MNDVYLPTEEWHIEPRVVEVAGKYVVDDGTTLVEVEDPDPYRCPICRELFEDGSTTLALPCEHRFCVACLEPYMHEKKQCPMCTQ